MNSSEKRLCGQIHPAKLATDVSMSILSLYLFRLHHFVQALVLHIVPSVVVGYLIIQYVSLERYARSRLGHYLAKYMTNKMQLLRLPGDVVTVVGAWFQVLWVIGLGLIVIGFGWARGLILPSKQA